MIVPFATSILSSTEKKRWSVRCRYTIYHPRTGVDVLRPPRDEVVGDEAAVDGVGGEAGQAEDGGVAEVATGRCVASPVVADRQLVQQGVLATGEVTLARLLHYTRPGTQLSIIDD